MRFRDKYPFFSLITNLSLLLVFSPSLSVGYFCSYFVFFICSFTIDLISRPRIDILLPKSMKMMMMRKRRKKIASRLHLEGSSIHFGRERERERDTKIRVHSIHLLFIEQFLLIVTSLNLFSACSQQIVLYLLLCFSLNLLTYLLDNVVCVNLIVPFVSSIIFLFLSSLE